MADMIKTSIFSTIKSKILIIVGIISAVLVVGALIFVIVWLATKSKMITFFPEFKVIDIENSDTPVSQKALDNAIKAGQEIYNKIAG